MTQRRDFIALATLAGANVSELCRRFGVSRKTGHKWLGRYREGGVEVLADYSRQPKTHLWTTTAAPRDAILALHAEQPTRTIRRRTTAARRRRTERSTCSSPF